MPLIVDYGMGNIRSVAKSFEAVGEKVSVSSSAEDVRKCDSLVLPGVGAFGDAMVNLDRLGLTKPLIEAITVQKKPFLGICLGMQLLAELSFEHGEHRGLGLVKGSVRRLPNLPDVRVPHVGWNDIQIRSPGSRLFQGLGPSAAFYFVHSYHLGEPPESIVAATCTHGSEFVAAVVTNNIFAVQFHPEKSQKAGQLLLRNFSVWSKELKDSLSVC